jgi:hypothetical protein
VEVVTIPVIVPVEDFAERKTPGSPILPPMTASRAELLAEQADDPAETARCYQLFLVHAGESGLSPKAGDTWLLTSLKNAAFKEKFHVANTDG